MKQALNIPLIAGCLVLCSCQSLYYNTMEKFGVHKREILVDRVEDAREAQEEAKEQFQSTFEEFVAVSGVEVGKLQSTYKRLNSALERSREKAEEVHEKVESIESVSEALFKEWENELAEYTRDDLRRSSQEQLRETRQLAGDLLKTMREAASKMDPVLAAFSDQVLFLKHNLNAQAIARLSETSVKLREEVNELIREMEASIDEANSFIAQMRVGTAG